MTWCVLDMENKNYLHDKRNMIAMLIVIAILSASAIGMLLSVHSVVRSNAPNVIGGEGDDILTGGEGAQRFVCGGGEDTILDYDGSEGDTKTEDCENS
jgi:Ca2+-binding RTX toxin-like protein